MKKIRLLTLLLCITTWAGATGFDTPRQALDAYLSACREGDYGAAESCYTGSSRKLAETQTEALEEPRDPEVLKQFYKRIEGIDFRLEQVNPKRAIFWPEDENFPPFFMRIQSPEEGWRIDYHFMASYIRVGEDGWSWRDPRILDIWKKRE